MKIDHINIFNYLDYREWMIHYYENKKKTYSSFSLRLFAKKINIDFSLLSKVLRKERHLGPESTFEVSKYFGFDKNEIEYFNTLIAFDKAKKADQKQSLFREILQLRKLQNKIIPRDQYSFYSEWHHSALRNLLQLTPFYGKNYQELGRKLSPTISAQEAKESIALLKKLNLIFQDSTGLFHLSELSVTTGDLWIGHAIKEYHKINIDLAKESIDRFKPDERDVSAITLNIGPDDLFFIKEKIKNLRHEIIRHVNQKAMPDRVYQLNLQLFPLSKKGSEL